VSLSANTQTILLLTSPLHLGRSGQQAAILTPGEYKKLARFLRQEGLQPADLLTEELHALSDKLESIVNPERLQSLLGRGFQLSQAVEHWQSRAIWVLSRADAEYPKVLKVRLKEESPAVLYGCGNKNLLDSGGLAVVGSYAINVSIVDLWIMLGLGVIGYLMRVFSVPREPMVLGLVLGTMAEGELARAMSLVHGDVGQLIMGMLRSPICLIMLALIAFSLWSGLRKQIAKPKQAA